MFTSVSQIGPILVRLPINETLPHHANNSGIFTKLAMDELVGLFALLALGAVGCNVLQSKVSQNAPPYRRGDSM